MKRLNKEYKLDVCRHVLVKYGSVNKDNPQVIYVNGRCWISPTENMNYESVIRSIEKEMRKDIKVFFMDCINFDKKFILDFDLNTENMAVGGKKFLSFDFYLRQNELNKKPLKELKGVLLGKISTVVNNLVYQFVKNGFTIEKKK